ncbi:MAG: nucleotidyltransferase domain-containing protein [Ruminococcus sp.]|nr:nucleotidyltransferase domain-containing protein [Ruminococcus sp.]
MAESYKVDRVCLFGSYARGDAREDSDVDLIVDAENVHGWQYFGLYEDLREAFEKDNKEIDLVSEEQLIQNKNDPLNKRFVQEVELDRREIYRVQCIPVNFSPPQAGKN